MEKQHLIKLINDTLVVMGEAQQVIDIIVEPTPKPQARTPYRPVIEAQALPIHPAIHYQDLNRIHIPIEQAVRRFFDGQPVYVNEQRYEKE